MTSPPCLCHNPPKVSGTIEPDSAYANNATKGTFYIEEDGRVPLRIDYVHWPQRDMYYFCLGFTTAFNFKRWTITAEAVANMGGLQKTAEILAKNYY